MACTRRTSIAYIPQDFNNLHYAGLQNQALPQSIATYLGRDPAHKVDIKSCACRPSQSITTRMLAQAVCVWHAPRCLPGAPRAATLSGLLATRWKVARSA
jgi:hypothetical protein